jgi:hypothetical protein
METRCYFLVVDWQGGLDTRMRMEPPVLARGGLRLLQHVSYGSEPVGSMPLSYEVSTSYIRPVCHRSFLPRNSFQRVSEESTSLGAPANIRNDPDFFALASWRQTTRHLKNVGLDQISSEVQAGDAIVWYTPLTIGHTKHDIFWHPYTLTVFKKKVH